MNLILKVFQDSFNFEGRSTRSEYWLFVLFCIISSILLMFLDVQLGTFDSKSGIGYINTIYSLILIIPTISLSVRRLHDIGKSGWWYFIVLIPLIGGLVLLYFFILPSDENENEYGINPESELIEN